MLIKENKFFILDRPYKTNLKHLAKKILRVIPVVSYSVKYKLIKAKTNSTPTKYNVAVCAIFKNEAPYLREWLEFNHLIGIDHFYLYNNNSEDDFEVVLRPYLEKGWVSLTNWPQNHKQMESYMDCIEKYSSETKWLGFIDIDEFVVPKSTDTIGDFLKEYENYGSVLIYWRLFGSSGLMKRSLSGLVTENFSVCWPKYCDIGKCFYNTAFEFNPKSDKSNGLHHSFWANYKGKEIPPVNIFGHLCTGNRNRADTADFPIQINHYFTKSYEEYAMKKAKGDVFYKTNPHDEEYFFEHEMKCTSTDFSAYKYLVKLKQEMEKTNE